MQEKEYIRNEEGDDFPLLAVLLYISLAGGLLTVWFTIAPSWERVSFQIKTLTGFCVGVGVFGLIGFSVTCFLETMNEKQKILFESLQLMLKQIESSSPRAREDFPTYEQHPTLPLPVRVRVEESETVTTPVFQEIVIPKRTRPRSRFLFSSLRKFFSSLRGKHVLGLRRKKTSRLTLSTMIIVAAIGGSYLVALATLNTLTPFLPVAGTSMLPTLKEGDLVVLKGVNPEDIVVGDIIAFKVPPALWEKIYPPILVHRVTSVTGGLKTKGDNGNSDPWTVPAENVIGKAVGVVPYVGLVVLLFKSPGGLALIVSTTLLSTLYEYFKKKGRLPKLRRFTRRKEA